jgi:hypothetical protein
VETTECGMGWNPRPHDPRDWPVEQLYKLIKLGVATPMSWYDPVVLAQGGTQHCCGFAGAGWSAAAQADAVCNPGITDADGHRLYYLSKRWDDDGAANIEGGSTLRSLAKVLLHDEQSILAYAFGTFEQAQEWVRSKGSAIIGIPWTQNMFQPDANYLLCPTGPIAGGHGTLWTGSGYRIAGSSCEQITNSWSKAWGVDGRAWIKAVDLQTLFNMGGEALLAVRAVNPLTERRRWEEYI